MIIPIRCFSCGKVRIPEAGNRRLGLGLTRTL